ncbi:MAG: hypothetical protein U5L96_03110 [Owenweeksia sp.]|nr:hypothetical protein [Owenweeksia sp.]
MFRASEIRFIPQSSAGQLGGQAVIRTPWIDVSALARPYLQFYYHRFGNQLGDLLVQVREQNTPWDTLGTITTEDQHAETDPYLEMGLRILGKGDTIQIRFVSLSQGCCAGDMAIDEVSLKEAPSRS